MKKHLIQRWTLVWIMAATAALPVTAAGYAKQDIPAIVKDMAAKLGMPADKRTDLMVNLEAAMSRATMNAVFETRTVKGILVFGANEGGFILKFMTGEGLVRFEGGLQDGVVHLKTWSLGASIGGSAMWGVALIVDLKDVGHFGGDYTGTVQDATAADTTTYKPVVLSRANDRNGQMAHDLYVITSGRGFSANMGVAKMTITKGW